MMHHRTARFGTFGRKVITLVAPIALGLFAGGASVALAALTLSGASITGDASFNAITGVASGTLDLGSGSTLSLQTTNNGPVTLGSGVLTVGGNEKIAGTLNVTSTFTAQAAATFNAALTQSGGLVSLATTTIAGQATTTALSITGLAGASGCLSVTASGAVATSTCSGAGAISSSSAITANNFPFWANATGGLSGTSTLSISGTTLTQAGNLLLSAGSVIDSSAAGTLAIGNTTSTNITIGRSGQTVSFPGNASTTGTATFLAALTQSGGTASLATTTVGGSLTINSGTAILKHLSATSSITFGVVASSTCATQTMTVTGANAGDNVYAAPTPVASGIETQNVSWSTYASSTNTIAIKACNPTTANTASIAAEVWRADVWQH